MTLFKNRYRIESTRLQDWDYSNNAAYFVTICTHNMKSYFGKVVNNNVNLSGIGKIVEEEWLKTCEIRENIVLDEYIIMPNHMHGILMITNDNDSGMHRASLPNIIKGFKSACTSRIHNLGYKDFKWQSRYHDHIIRSEIELFNIRRYIMNNSVKMNNQIKWNWKIIYKELSRKLSEKSFFDFKI